MLLMPVSSESLCNPQPKTQTNRSGYVAARAGARAPAIRTPASSSFHFTCDFTISSHCETDFKSRPPLPFRRQKRWDTNGSEPKDEQRFLRKFLAKAIRAKWRCWADASGQNLRVSARQVLPGKGARRSALRRGRVDVGETGRAYGRESRWWCPIPRRAAVWSFLVAPAAARCFPDADNVAAAS